MRMSQIRKGAAFLHRLPQFKPQKSLTFAVEASCIKNVGY
jgi:hypothetical protein